MQQDAIAPFTEISPLVAPNSTFDSPTRFAVVLFYFAGWGKIQLSEMRCCEVVPLSNCSGEQLVIIVRKLALDFRKLNFIEAFRTKDRHSALDINQFKETLNWLKVRAAFQIVIEQ